jgi:hypothetical protein
MLWVSLLVPHVIVDISWLLLRGRLAWLDLGDVMWRPA